MIFEDKKQLIIIRPISELNARSERMEDVLSGAARKLENVSRRIRLVERVSELENISLVGERIIFAICLTEVGINMEYYRLLEWFRVNPGCLNGAIGGVIVDGSSDLFTKALARRLVFSANLAGCTFPGKPLVEATGSLRNFDVLARVWGLANDEIYRQQVEILLQKVSEFEPPLPESDLKILALHAGSRKTSNSLILWDKVKDNLEGRARVHEISLRNGIVQDCIGCSYEQCRHFGENDGCFYGGIMTQEVYPEIVRADALVMVCANYNDALGANLTAFINRLTALFRIHDFSKKRIYAIVVSGYSGGDIVAEQVIGALNFNKSFILPARFCMVETANDPGSILKVEGIDAKAVKFAERIW